MWQCLSFRPVSSLQINQTRHEASNTQSNLTPNSTQSHDIMIVKRQACKSLQEAIVTFSRMDDAEEVRTEKIQLMSIVFVVFAVLPSHFWSSSSSDLVKGATLSSAQRSFHRRLFVEKRGNEQSASKVSRSNSRLQLVEFCIETHKDHMWSSKLLQKSRREFERGSYTSFLPVQLSFLENEPVGIWEVSSFFFA